jgi:hypothetical protein
MDYVKENVITTACGPRTRHLVTLISVFRRDVDYICGLLGILTRDDGTDTLSRNVGRQLSQDAV